MSDTLVQENKEVRKFESSHGYFTQDGREYVVTNPITPRPWVNVISNGDYGIIESQIGTGFSWRDNSNLSRITRWEQDMIRDVYGKFVYVRDNETAQYWSACYKPCCTNFDFFEARHGIGYSKLTASYNGIRTEKLVFVDAKHPMEVWQLKVKNESNQKRNISLFSYFEWCLGNAADTHREFQKTFIETDFDKTTNVLYGKKRLALVPGFISTGLSEKPLEAFHAVTNMPLSGYDGDKESFFGMYRDIQNPISVEEGQLKGVVGKNYDATAALQVTLKLEPNEEKTVIFVVGADQSRASIKKMIQKYDSEEKVQAGLEEVHQMWANLIEKSWVETPDDAFNFMTNIWVKYQTISARLWARCGYYQSSGGYGYRDQLQDCQIFFPLKPELAKKQIILHAEQQFPDGVVRHWWHHGTDIGPVTNHSDDLLWLTFITVHYLEETVDYNFLNVKVPFLPDPKTGKKIAGTIYQHCLASIEKVLSRFSKRGLPLIGEGDWNDGMSHVGPRWKGESVWLAHFLYGVLNKFAPICEMKKDKKRATRYLKRAQAVKKAINAYAWDGEWYICATRDNGRPIGSKSERDGKIHLNPQTWAIINGTATPERAKKCMDSAEKILFQKYGPLLLTPAYSTTDPTVGYLSRYAPSVRENGGLYTHAGTWAIQAVTMTGDGDKAYKVYNSFNPILRGLNPELYYVEPYVLPGNVDGPDSPNFGRGGWTWYTGSAGWLGRIGMNYMLGIRPKPEGLEILPCIPHEWNGFKMKRLFRGVTYEISVKNPNHVCTGIKKITVNGKQIEGNLITPQKSKNPVQVDVIMG